MDKAEELLAKGSLGIKSPLKSLSKHIPVLRTASMPENKLFPNIARGMDSEVTFKVLPRASTAFHWQEKEKAQKPPPLFLEKFTSQGAGKVVSCLQIPH